MTAGEENSPSVRDSDYIIVAVVYVFFGLACYGLGRLLFG